MNNKLEFKLLTETAKYPTRAYEGDAGIDIYYDGTNTVSHPQSTLELRTGISAIIPKGYYLSIKTRSSMAKKGIQMHDGTIDYSYTGEITIFTYNCGLFPVPIKKGDKLAQIVIHRVHDEIVDIVPLTQEQRGEKGIGSSNSLEESLRNSITKQFEEPQK